MTSAGDYHKIADLLSAGYGIAEIQQHLLPASWQQIIRVCATAGPFTEQLFADALCPYGGQDAPSLTDLQSRRLIEPVPGAESTWQVSPADAEDWVKTWVSRRSRPAPEMVRLERELAKWHEARGNRVEQVRHLLLPEPRQAIEICTSMFNEADNARDFARCQDLIDLLADPIRASIIRPEVGAFCHDRADYLRSRSFWSDDYSQSAQFLMPPGLAERTTRLLSDEGPRVWQLFAPGGTGKTMQSRWLIARHCVTAAVDVPCARIDFDVIDPVAAVDRPWLLLLEVADQLERRWPRGVFARLDSYTPYRSLLRRTTSELSAHAAKGIEDLNATVAETRIVDMFVRRYNGAANGRPVILMLDTLEQVLVASAADVTDLSPLFDLLASLLRRCEGLRLVLAGRSDLGKQAPTELRKLGQVESIEVGDFTQEQADHYLKDIRGITHEERRAAVIAQAGGQPMMLALLADDVDEDPQITAEKLREHTEPGIELLIDRFIKRIDDHYVRWLVRYGVVPRRLHWDDVHSVMWPFLIRGRTGQGSRDNPRDDNHEEVFSYGPEPKDADSLWNQLLFYARTVGAKWISPAADKKSVIFHVNVRAPMRGLLASQPVFHDLHKAFTDRYEELARLNPSSPVGYLREVIYHRAQLADSELATFWNDRITIFRDNGDLNAVEELARELLRDDYLDNDGRPRTRGDGQPIVPYETVLSAYIYLAFVNAERARRAEAGPSDPLWSAVRRQLAGAADFRQRTGIQLVSATENAVCAAVYVMQGRPEAALELASKALNDASPDSRVDLLRVIGDAKQARGDPDATRCYSTALDAARIGRRKDQQRPLTLALATQSEAQGRFDEALQWLHQLAPIDKLASDIGLARVNIECYEPYLALELLQQTDLPDVATAVEIGLLKARANAMLGRADHAFDELRVAQKKVEGTSAEDRYVHLARILQLRATVLGEVLAVDEAEDCFQRAVNLWTEMGFSEGHPECGYLYRRFLVRNAGDFAAAGRLSKPPMESERFISLLWNELSSELRPSQHLVGDHNPPAAASFERLPPQQAARIIAAYLARSWSRYRHLVPTLAKALKRVTPYSARLVVLSELRRCEIADQGDLATLRLLLAVDPSNCSRQADEALQWNLLAELARLDGDHVLASNKLTVLMAGLSAADTSLARWRWLQARVKLNVQIDDDQLQEAIGAFLEVRQPLLRAAGLITLISADAADTRTDELLRRARDCCEGIDRPTCWAADVFDLYGRRTSDQLFIARARDFRHQLGSLAPDRSSDRQPVFANRPGELSVGLPRLSSSATDLAELPRRLVADWPALRNELSRKLFGDPAWHRNDLSSLRALRLQSDELVLQAMPWELAVPPERLAEVLDRTWPTVAYRSLPEVAGRADTRWLQRGLVASGHEMPVDGVIGPLTLAGLQLFAPHTAIPISLAAREMLSQVMNRPPRYRRPAPDGGQPPVAVVLRPDPVAVGDGSRSAELGVDTADVYRLAGLEVTSAASLADLPSHRHELRVAVLHLSARMDMIGTDPHFDFSPTDSPDRLRRKALGHYVRPKDVARWLRGQTAGTEPLIVLDPPAPASPYDVPWQLWLRNLFAAALFTEASGATIIATGVHSASSRHLGTIANGVAGARPLAAIARGLRHTAGGGYLNRAGHRPRAGSDWGEAADELAAGATAVFAAPTAFTLPEKKASR